jgi:hypothetical protein
MAKTDWRQTGSVIPVNVIIKKKHWRNKNEKLFSCALLDHIFISSCRMYAGMTEYFLPRCKHLGILLIKNIEINFHKVAVIFEHFVFRKNIE